MCEFGRMWRFNRSVSACVFSFFVVAVAVSFLSCCCRLVVVLFISVLLMTIKYKSNLSYKHVCINIQCIMFVLHSPAQHRIAHYFTHAHTHLILKGCAFLRSVRHYYLLTYLNRMYVILNWTLLYIGYKWNYFVKPRGVHLNWRYMHSIAYVNSVYVALEWQTAWSSDTSI